MEKAVEDLSELLELPIEPENIANLRQRVTDKTASLIPHCVYPVAHLSLQVYVQKRNEIVLEDTANGFLEGRWKWNIPIAGFEMFNED